MAQWQPITNLRSRIIHHPPVAVFFMCLLVLAGAFVSIGIYSQNHDIKNPDINMDWNQMLGSLADLKFCTQLNDTDLLEEKPDMNSPQLLDELVHNTQQKSEVISVFLQVPLMPVGDYTDHNSISATLLGSQLGLKGSAGKESLNISLFLDVQPRIPATDSALIQNMQIKPQSYKSCLKITTPHHILPQTPSPPECPSTKDLENNLSPIRAHAIEANKKSTNAPPCLSLEFIPDPKLTVLLTQVNGMKILDQLSELFNAQLKIYKVRKIQNGRIFSDEKALARYHLLLVSIVLLALCIIMCLFGTLTCSKSRRHLANDPQKDTLLG